MSVTLHTYTKTEYKNAPDHKTTPLNATNLNNSEDGIENAYADIAAVYSEQTTEDAKRALKSDLTSISETGATASQAISAGTFFYLEGTLVRAKVDIANGATFTLNTNYEVMSAGALNSLSFGILYSDQEHIVGKWRVGGVEKDLWARTVTVGQLPSSAGPKTVAHNISNIDLILHVEGTTARTTKVTLPLPAIDLTSLANQIFAYADATNIYVYVGGNQSVNVITYVTMFYIKTT